MNIWRPSSPKLSGAVWLDMIRFYALEFNYRDLVVSISHQLVYRSDKYWNRKISVEDPVIPKSNLSRSMSNNKMCEYMLERFKFTYLYFGVPRTIRGHLYDGIAEEPERCRSVVFHKATLIKNNTSNNTPGNNLEKIYNKKWDPLSLIEEIKAMKRNSRDQFPPVELQTVRVRIYSLIGNYQQEKSYVHLDDARTFETIFPEWMYEYKFDANFLQNGTVNLFKNLYQISRSMLIEHFFYTI